MTPPPLRLENLRVGLPALRPDGGTRRVEAVGRGDEGVSLEVPANTCVALVGESGSGKSATAMSVVRLLPDGAECRGRVLWRGEDLLCATDARMRGVRGREIACVFQDPSSSLNPVWSIGRQIVEPLRRHLGLGRTAARARAQELLAEVGMPEPARRMDAYPHELSGGQQQRAMIAMALACEPELLIADEPTASLDPAVQRQILELFARLQARRGLAMLFISHDLDAVGEIAQQVVVMRRGLVCERGATRETFAAPRHAYTRALLACRPRLQSPPHRLPVADVPRPAPAPDRDRQPQAAAGRDPDAPFVLQVQGLSKSFWIRDGSLRPRREFKAVQDLHFSLRRGHTLGVVGESGSGKSTMALTLLRLHDASTGPVRGSVLFNGHDLLALPPADRLAMRRRMQIVFQNPHAALNPRFTIGQTLVEPMAIHRIGKTAQAREQRALAWLERVGLDADALPRYPHEFSGGQRQRIAIARSLTLSPDVLVLDEAVCALDVPVQAQVLNLLKDLQDELGLSYVFISHDLAAVGFMSDDIMVMKDGRVVERQPARSLLARPQHACTRGLIDAASRGAGGRQA